MFNIYDEDSYYNVRLSVDVYFLLNNNDVTLDYCCNKNYKHRTEIVHPLTRKKIFFKFYMISVNSILTNGACAS